AYDRAKASESPVSWNLRSVMGTSAVLALGLAAFTFVLHTTTLVAPGESGETEPVVFLEIALTQNWLLFSTRTKGPFYKDRPSLYLFLAVLVVDVVATLMSCFGWLMTNGAHINAVTAVRVWLYSLGVLVILDIIRRVFADKEWWDRVLHLKSPKKRRRNRAREDREYLLLKVSKDHEMDQMEQGYAVAD
ncbi:plasma membrane H+-ATPase, partial [Borealophlyctis nickersoniae]